ncbi:putative myb DNA-binding domain containing protein [Rhypophila decipiens]
MSHPTLINLPQPPSNPDTPSEMPGTPTSTTTSLSTLSTTAIKDGHRGHGPHSRHAPGHHHNLSTTSLEEAERADRISRLAGMSIATLRGPPPGLAAALNADSSQSPQTTPTSTGFPPLNHTTAPGGLTPAYFDQAGQPVGVTKMSTVGSASATESVGGNTTTELAGDRFTAGGESAGGRDYDEDMLSMDTDDRETETQMDSASASASGYGEAMDEDLDHFVVRSVGGFEDRMSDDGNASLVGFGEGAGSTVSGPIYHRRPIPGGGTMGAHQYPQHHSSAASAMAAAAAASGSGGGLWGLERSNSGLSAEGGLRRDAIRGTVERDFESMGSADTPVSQSALMERQQARMVDGVSLEGTSASAMAAAAAAARGGGGTGVSSTVPVDDDVFVDTTTTGPVPALPLSRPPGQHPTSALRETAQPQYHTSPRQSYQPEQYRGRGQGGSIAPGESQSASTSGNSHREAAERIVQESLGDGDPRVGDSVLGSPKGETGPLGRFFFEEKE